ncbi:FAD dependent oxidoreductase [Laetiporus sulphureus 93-53]|uniref:FAD dependent oxidoreductase n=1 Tax=Laetiporus sulphureus 93-53 TaxID=1314785 RepID=A0A165BQ67_9APHY|nr:FAD dependent oxidoreductase [Laetiporus sulphureus 93-53]KZT01455.1 FAD dependent oxidoreductase [Laetiporus sulphureus 93-53]
MSIDKNSEIVIVGAGCFGLSTAYHLLKRGYSRITLLDSAEKLPAPHAASTDINKIVRSSYADLFYAKFARDAIAEWTNDTELWGDAYHESGVVVLVSGDAGSYADQAYENDVKLGARVEPLADAAALRNAFPPGVKTCSFEGRKGYLNLDGGWAHSSQGIERLMWRVRAMGARIVAGKAAVDLVKAGGKTVGVKCADGSVFPAGLVVIAAGSWTASSFPSLKLSEKCTATGQSVGKIQLTPEEAEVYRKNPVYLDLTTGFYIFPPSEQNIVKCAIHTAGYTNPQPTREYGPTVSTPVFVGSHAEQASRVPKRALQELRQGLAAVFPDLAAKPWHSTRMCWYLDTPDEDWLIGFHPSDPQVVLATAGSGHAYKFLPVLGRLVADAIEGTMALELVKKFAVDRPTHSVVHSRPDFEVRKLEFNDMCTEADLLPPPSTNL